MTTLCGRYVKTFREASHAMPNGMHMSADYPFMLPAIKSVDDKQVTILSSRGDRQEATVKIIRRGGREYAYIEQSSTFERMFGRKPARFKLLPFKDGDTPAIGESDPYCPFCKKNHPGGDTCMGHYP